MKTNEDYLKDYDHKLDALIAKGEIWRIRVTRQEYLAEIERLRIYEIDELKSKRFNEYHIHKSINCTISIMLMDRVTHEEAKKQFENNRLIREKYLMEEIPEVMEGLNKIKVPISFNNIIKIYKWLFYKQITYEDIPDDVLNEFKETEQYEILVRNDNVNSHFLY